MQAIVTYLYINSVSLSIAFNTLLGGLPYQTFSARNWEWKRENKWNVCSLIDHLVQIEDEHCMHCWIRWKIGMYAVLNYEKEANNYERHRPTNTHGL